MPGCCRVAGCCRVLPDCRVPARTSSQLVWALRLPGCQVRLPGCRVRLPGCRVAGGCRVLQGCRVVAGVLPGWCRFRLPGCQGQGSSSLACKQTAPTPREIQCLRTRGAQQLHEVSHRAVSPTSMSLGSICSHVDHSALRRGAARRPSMMLHRDRLGSAWIGCVLPPHEELIPGAESRHSPCRKNPRRRSLLSRVRHSCSGRVSGPKG